MKWKYAINAEMLRNGEIYTDDYFWIIDVFPTLKMNVNEKED